MKTHTIDSEREKVLTINLIKEMPVDGSCEVITKKVDKSSTAKQRRLQWKWNTEVAESGLGRDDTKAGVHLTAKWLFARPILLRDDEVYGATDSGFFEVIKDHPEDIKKDYIKQFASQYISTESMTRKQRAEYLTDFQRYWAGKGVNLTDPDDYGRNLLRHKPKKAMEHGR